MSLYGHYNFSSVVNFEGKRHFLSKESSVQSKINLTQMFEYNIITISRSPRDEGSDVNKSLQVETNEEESASDLQQESS